jgi:uncharacterized membrane protein
MSNPVSWFLVGLGAGAGAMFLCDPDRGARRRAAVRERATRTLHDVQDLAGKAQRDARNRARGLVARSARGLTGAAPGPQHGALLRSSAPAVRFARGTAGVALAAWGLHRRGLIGFPVALAGLRLVADAGLSMGSGFGRDTILVQKTITVGAPRDEVFAFWSRFDNFPRFMEHVLEVKATDERRSHWKVSGPAGVPVEWDAEIVDIVPDREIAWHSLDGSIVDHQGVVQFDDAPGGGTRIMVRMAYRPPGGALGHAAASFLSGDPRTVMNDDLLRFKSLLETGKTRAHGEEAYHRVPPA